MTKYVDATNFFFQAREAEAVAVIVRELSDGMLALGQMPSLLERIAEEPGFKPRSTEGVGGLRSRGLIETTPDGGLQVTKRGQRVYQLLKEQA